MKNFFFFFIGISICTLSTFSQGADIWYFGENVGLDFNTNPPTVIEGITGVDASANLMEMAATITDDDGNFLFAVIGNDIYSADLTKRGNTFSSDEMGETSQGAMIIPVPGTDDEYYVTTVPYGTTTCNSGPPGYTRVRVNGISGYNITNNITIIEQVALPTSNIAHGQMIIPKKDTLNGGFLGEYWLYHHGRNSDEFHRYSIENGGIVFDQTISEGPSFNQSNCEDAYPDVMNIMKSNGFFNQFLIVNGDNVYLFDVDASTGDITYQNSAGPITQTCGIEFSAAGKNVFVSTGTSGGLSPRTIFKIPVSPGGLSGSQLGAASSIGSMQLLRGGVMQMGPDGNIYIGGMTDWNGTPKDSYLGVIYDTDGSAYLDPKGVKIPRSIIGVGLPAIPASLVFNRVNIWDETACGGDFSELSYTFFGLEQAAGDRLWQIFEGNATGVPVATSTEKYVDHYWSEAGNYAVTLEINDFYGNTYHDTLYKYVNEPYLINIDPVDSVYPNQTVSFSSSDYNADSYRWYDTQTSPDVLKTGATFDTILYDDEVCVWVEPDLELAGPFTAGHDEDAGYQPTDASEGVHEFNALKPIKIDGFTVTGTSWLDEGTDEISIEIRLGSSVVAGPVFTTMNKLGDTYLTDLNLIVPQGDGYSIHITGGSYFPRYWSDIKSIPGLISVTASNLLKDWQVYEMHPCSERKRVCAYSKDIATSSLDIDNSKFNIYPNPTNSNFTVFCPDNFEFTVLDVKGRIVKSGRANDSIDIIMKDEGIYFVLINQENQIFSAKKIVVNK